VLNDFTLTTLGPCLALCGVIRPISARLGATLLNEVPRLVNDSFSHLSRTMNVRMQGRCRMPVIVDQTRGWTAGARPISNEKRKMALSMRSEAIVLEHWPVY
jgi:hypothetical protein